MSNPSPQTQISPKLDNLRQLIANDDFAAANTELQQVREMGRDDVPLHRLGVKISFELQDWHRVADHCERLLTLKAPDPGQSFFGAPFEAFTNLQNWHRGLKYFTAVGDLYGPANLQLGRRYQMLFQTTPQQQLPEILKAKILGPNGTPEHIIAFNIYHSQFGPLSPEMTALAKQCIAKWPDHPVSVKVEQNCICSLSDSMLRENQTGPDLSPSETMSALLATYAATGTPESAESRRHRADIIKQDFGNQEIHRPIIQDIRSSPVQVSPVGKSGTTVLVFCGLGDNAFMPLPLLDAYLAAQDVTAIYLRDLKRCLFLSGIDQLGDGYEATCQSLRTLIDDLPGHQRLLVLSASGGGMGAIHYGCDLQADKMLLFSPPSNASPEFLQQIGDQRAQVIQRRLAEVEPKSLLDGRHKLLSHSHRPEIQICYAAGNQVDKSHAQNLESIAEVELSPIPECQDHNAAQVLLRQKQFGTLMSSFCHGLPSQQHEVKKQRSTL